MNDKNFIAALEECFEDECVEISSCEVPEFTPSEHFETKMHKLIEQRKKPFYHMICTKSRRVACIIAAIFLLSVSSLTVEAVRSKNKELISTSYPNQLTLTAKDAENSKFPQYIETMYMIKKIPDGFHQASYGTQEDCIESDFCSETDFIQYKQYTKKSYQGNYNKKNLEVKELSEKFGETYYILDWKAYREFVWDNGEYIFTVKTSLPEETALEICKSLKPIKRLNGQTEHRTIHSKEDLKLENNSYSSE